MVREAKNWAFCWILASVCERCPRPGGKEILSWSLTAARKPPSCVQGTVGQLEGGCLKLERGQEQAQRGLQPPGSGRGRHRAILWFTAMWWAEDRWAGADRVLRRPLCGPCSITVSGSEADTMFCSLGLWKAAPSQSLFLVGV